MKKSLLCLVAFAIVFCLTVHADDVPYNDYSKYSDEELLNEYLSIESALLARSSAFALELHAGKYEVGKDIPAGTYRFECPGAYSSTQVKIYTSSSEKYPADSYLLAELYSSSIIGKVELKDGFIVEVTQSTVRITDYNAAQTEISGAVAEETAEVQPASGKEMEVSPGKYLVGDEIPAGVYRVVCEDKFGFASVSVYDGKNSLLPSYETMLSHLFGNPEIGKLELKTGAYVEIMEGTVTFYPYTGIGQ